MYKIGFSVVPAKASQQYFEDLAKAGIQTIETKVSVLEEDNILDYKVYKKWADDNGIALWTYHLPYWSPRVIDISAHDNDFRKKSVEIVSRYIKKGAELGINKFILHSSCEPIEENERADRIKYAGESASEFARVAEKAIEGGVIAVEPLPRTCIGRDSGEILAILESNPALRVCLDLNHLLRERSEDFIRKLGKKIITLHVSDYDFINERHWLPGEGKNDWNAILDALEEVGYEGVWNYELGLNTPATIIRDRELTFNDLVRNAHELFARKKPTVFSHPVENLQ